MQYSCADVWKALESVDDGSDGSWGVLAVLIESVRTSLGGLVDERRRAGKDDLVCEDDARAARLAGPSIDFKAHECIIATFGGDQHELLSLQSCGC